jgi:hypothetical protein
LYVGVGEQTQPAASAVASNSTEFTGSAAGSTDQKHIYTLEG